ncbi:hypothetical protein ACWEPI_26360 [Streptomyces sp. NPDC004262]
MQSELLQGVDSFLTWLDDLAEAFGNDVRLAQLAFLVRRITADIETATEVTLAGYTSVALDAMRDVLEIEYLLHDFAINPRQVDKWLTADDTTLRREFAPVKVRERLKAAGIGNFGDNAESLDYKGHSMALHLRPRELEPLPGKGRAPDRALDRYMGFWEICDHSQAVGQSIGALTHALAPNSEADGLAKRLPEGLKDALYVTLRSQDHYQVIHMCKRALDEGHPRIALNVLLSSLQRAGFLKPSTLVPASIQELPAELARIADLQDGLAKSVAPLALAILASRNEWPKDDDDSSDEV